MKSISKFQKIFFISTIICLLITKIFDYVLSNTDSYLHMYQYQFFPIIRRAFDKTIGQLNAPPIYLLVLLLVCILAYITISWVRSKKHLSALIGYGCVVVWIYISFYTLWGYHYHAQPLSVKLDLINEEVDIDYIINEVDQVIHKLNILADDMGSDKDSLQNLDYQEAIHKAISSQLARWNIIREGRPTIREIKPSGVLLRFSTSGIYLPWVGEGHYDGGLHPAQIPTVSAHEMAHGLGFAHEGECNWIAFISCIYSSDQYLQYCGWIMYLRYLTRDLYYFDETIYWGHAYTCYNKSLLNDLEGIKNALNTYPDLMPRTRDFIYDSFLKRNGMANGLKSYGEFIGWYKAYKRIYNENPFG